MIEDAFDREFCLRASILSLQSGLSAGVSRWLLSHRLESGLRLLEWRHILIGRIGLGRNRLKIPMCLP